MLIPKLQIFVGYHMIKGMMIAVPVINGFFMMIFLISMCITTKNKDTDADAMTWCSELCSSNGFVALGIWIWVILLIIYNFSMIITTSDVNFLSSMALGIISLVSIPLRIVLTLMDIGVAQLERDRAGGRRSQQLAGKDDDAPVYPRDGGNA